MNSSPQPIAQQIAAKERQIIAYDKKIDALDETIDALKGKEDRYRNRRVKTEKRRNTLCRKREDAVNGILLIFLRAEGTERQHVVDQLGELLTTLSPDALLNERPKGDKQRDVAADAAADSQPQDTPSSAAPSTDDSGQASATTRVDGDAARSPDDTATTDSPDTATDVAEIVPRSPVNNVHGDAAPAEQRAQPTRADDPASVKPDDGPTEKQINYITSLIAKNPSQAKKIGVDARSLPTLSRQKASWIIKQLAPAGARASARPTRR